MCDSAHVKRAADVSLIEIETVQLCTVLTPGEEVGSKFKEKGKVLEVVDGFYGTEFIY